MGLNLVLWYRYLISEYEYATSAASHNEVLFTSAKLSHIRTASIFRAIIIGNA